jgi:hypothetical protein
MTYRVPQQHYIVMLTTTRHRRLEGETCSIDRYREAAKKDNYVWNVAYGTWEYKAPKRVRNKSMSNKQQQSWVLGMHRNWENQNQAERMAKITIKRDKINIVTILHCACKHASLYLCIIVQLLLSCVAGVPQIVRGWGVHCRRFFSTILTMQNTMTRTTHHLYLNA